MIMKPGNIHKPKRGDFLISEPFMNDPNFGRTVVYLCEHNEEGSFGFIINRPTEVKVCDILDIAEFCNEKVFVGGPVEQNTLHFILRGDKGIEGSVEIADNIFWGGNFDQLLSKMENKVIAGQDIRFFVGYSGWSDGQLDTEMGEGSWIVQKKPDPSLLFDLESEQQWREVLRSMGGEFKVIANYPTDPRLN